MGCPRGTEVLKLERGRRVHIWVMKQWSGSSSSPTPQGDLKGGRTGERWMDEMGEEEVGSQVRPLCSRHINIPGSATGREKLRHLPFNLSLGCRHQHLSGDNRLKAIAVL